MRWAFDGSLMCLVDYDARVLGEVLVLGQLLEQETLGHVAETRFLAVRIQALVATDAVADLIPQDNVHLLKDMSGQLSCSQRTGLGASHPQLAGELVKDEQLRHLGRLPRARLTRQDEDLTLVVGVKEVIVPSVDGQLASALENGLMTSRPSLSGQRRWPYSA